MKSAKPQQHSESQQKKIVFGRGLLRAQVPVYNLPLAGFVRCRSVSLVPFIGQDIHEVAVGPYF